MMDANIVMFMHHDISARVLMHDAGHHYAKEAAVLSGGRAT